MPRGADGVEGTEGSRGPEGSGIRRVRRVGPEGVKKDSRGLRGPRVPRVQYRACRYVCACVLARLQVAFVEGVEVDAVFPLELLAAEPVELRPH